MKCHRPCLGLLTLLTYYSIALWCSVSGTSLMKRIRERQSAEDALRGLEMTGDNWIHVPQPVQDVLMSIDDKLRSLDTLSYTLKLARLDFSLDQLVRRMENIESKLGRLETKFDLRMEKVEEVVVSKDIKEEFSNEHLSRKMETLNEKINNKAAYLDAKLDIKFERVINKLDLLERDLHNSVDDILERLIKGEEKCVMLENEQVKEDKKLDEIQADIRGVASFTKEELPNTIVQQFDSLNAEIDKIQVALLRGENRSEESLRNLKTNIADTNEHILGALLETSVKMENLSTTFNQAERGRMAVESYDADKTVTQEQLDNLTAILDKALSVHEAKFKELDSDVEKYTRKVINGIQELWKTSDELKSDLSNTLEQGSKTRELVRMEFQRLHEQIEPLPKLEPKLSDISEDLDKKVFELSTTVDNSFATLLVAQNTFIDSCKRIQQEETHVYDILQQIVYEMRNRSISDIHKISSELRSQSSQINRSLAHMLTAVLLTGNITTTAVNDLLVQLRQKEQCVVFKIDNVDWTLMESICQRVSIGVNIHNNSFNIPPRESKGADEGHTLGMRPNLTESVNESDISYDNDAEVSDPTLNLNEYEDYNLSEAYFPGNT